MSNRETDNTIDEKKLQLFLQQRELLNTFLEHGAISKAQYAKSLGDLKVKMGVDDNLKIDDGEVSSILLSLYS